MTDPIKRSDESSVGPTALDGGPSVLLTLDQVSKAYPGVRALDALSIEFAAGEIHGVVGENGAGKSTLVQIVGGGIAPDRGELRLNGAPIQFGGPWDSHEVGISVVYQEFQSLPAMTVTENVLLGSSDGRKAWINWPRAHELARRALRDIGLDLDVRTPMEDLSPAQRKLVEIARAARSNARLLLLDEPTAALEAADSQSLIQAMVKMRAAGKSVVFISHRLDEIMQCCDRISVLRDGRGLGTWNTAELSRDRLIELMIGESQADFFAHHATPPGEAAVLEVTGLTVGKRVREVNLTVNEGEVVGLAGVLGSGRSELAQSLFGIVRRDAGTIKVRGQDIAPRTPVDAIRAGIAYVPADRQRDGLVFTMDIQNNLSLAVLRRLKQSGFLSARKERELAGAMFERLRVIATGLSQNVETLSGGNQQKVMLGRWLAAEPSLLILDEPTQGIDIGAKAEVHRLIADLAARGLGVLLISSDLAELLSVSDRVVVIHEGAVVRQFGRGEATEAQVVLAASGERVA